VTNLRVKDLDSPVTAAKADWLPGTTWLGFTPSSSEPHAAARCEATICSQMRDGYVLEYVTHSIDPPNHGFENDPDYLEVANEHPKLAGRLIGVHRLRPTMRPLNEIIGHMEFERLQDMWAQGGKRRRWSVAFPIVESFEIEGKPPAADVLSSGAYKRLFQHPSGTLRPLNDEERAMIADLVLVPGNAINAWIAIEDEILMAEASAITAALVRDINWDLSVSTMEGMTEERKAKIRQRAAWLANRFASERRKAGTLFCDNCSFDPGERVAGTSLKPRSLLDVHHLHPLDEGKRRTWLKDFALLCPTCHRFEHLLSAFKKPSKTAIYVT
jgi:5-methylcytosine-specific restriction protein A